MTKEEAKAIITLCVDEGVKQGIVKANEFEELLDFLDNCDKQPSTPSNLDEAAEKYANKEFPDEPSCGQWGTGDYESPVDMEYPREIAKDAFKTGVEWHARQGQTFESVVWKDSDDGLYVEAFVDENKFKMADAVRIQVCKIE